MIDPLKTVQEELALSILINASRHNDYKRKALLDFVQASTREWLQGFADCERGEIQRHVQLHTAQAIGIATTISSRPHTSRGSI